MSVSLSQLLLLLFSPLFLSALTMAGKSPANTRARKGSLKDSLSPNDVLELIRASEERIKQCIKDEVSALTDKLSKIETTLCSVQNDCALLEAQVEKIKHVINCQQIQLEDGERRLREKNIIIHNIPETNVSTATEQLEDDFDKVRFLCRNVDIRRDRNDLVSMKRLGKRTSQKPRPIKVEMRHKELKIAFLNKRKSITRNQEIQTYFQNKVFVTDN